MDLAELHILTGWFLMLFGVLTGSVIGLYFHREDWAGGYSSFRRRLMRLGHIAFFGMGFLNLVFSFSLSHLPLPDAQARVASLGILIGGVGMPLICFLTAWRKPFRHLFPIPVVGILVATLASLGGWLLK